MARIARVRAASTPASPQPRSPASVSAQVPQASPTTLRATPRVSSFPVACSSRLSGTAVRAHTMTTAERGTLIRNTQRHPGPSTRPPPMKGPIAPATPPSADHKPTATARSDSRKLACRMAMLPGVRSAPPTPCRIRVATSTPMLGATPQSSDALANHATPMRKMRRLPRRSPSAPASRMNEASPSR